MRNLTLGVVILFSLIICAFIYRDYQQKKKIASLSNQIATKDKTIEIQAGVFGRQAAQLVQLSDLLRSSDEQLKSLAELLESKGDKLLAANRLMVKWRNQYEALAEASQSTQSGRQRVDFKKDFGPYEVSGHTLTDPAEAHLKLSQLRPLGIGLVISQEKDGDWVAHATSDDPNQLIDIEISAVNPNILKPKWYEKVGVTGSIIGSEKNVIGSVGLTYKVNSVDVGPVIGTSSDGSRFYGGSITWKPFEK